MTPHFVFANLQTKMMRCVKEMEQQKHEKMMEKAGLEPSDHQLNLGDQSPWGKMSFWFGLPVILFRLVYMRMVTKMESDTQY